MILCSDMENSSRLVRAVGDAGPYTSFP